MIRIFEEQERQRSLQVGNALRKSDLLLHEKVCVDNRRENTKKIPYQNECVRKELQNALAKNYSKICKDNLRICEESLGRRLGAYILKNSYFI